SMFSGLAAINHLIPSLGAPTALTFGGRELGAALSDLGSLFSSAASAGESSARSSGLMASFDRRGEEWKHQFELAKRDLDQIQKQISAARFREEIAQKSLEVHDKTIDQTEEVFNLYRDHFSNLGRFTWLSTQLHRFYRMAFNSAFSMARLAEQA